MGFRVGECPQYRPRSTGFGWLRTRDSRGETGAPVNRPNLPLGLGTRQHYPGVDRGGGRAWATSWWLSAGVGQVNDEGERNE